MGLPSDVRGRRSAAVRPLLAGEEELATLARGIKRSTATVFVRADVTVTTRQAGQRDPQEPGCLTWSGSHARLLAIVLLQGGSRDVDRAPSQVPRSRRRPAAPIRPRPRS